MNARARTRVFPRHSTPAAVSGSYREDRFVNDGRTPFEIDSLRADNRTIRVAQRQRLVFDFGSLTEFVSGAGRRRVLVVAPLAGAYPILFRDVVVGLLRHANVAITDWRDPYYVPKSRGEFGLAENISYVLEMIRAIGPGGHVIGICQGAVSALAATALLSTLDEAAAPRSLTLIAGPIDPLANPTRVGLASRAFPPEFQQNVMRTVPDRFPGRGRRIYPANAQFTALMGYLARHGLLGEVFWKLWQDDGEDPLRFPFSGLLMRLMNLPAELVLDIVKQVFVERQLCTGRLTVRHQSVLPSAIHRTGLMTIEAQNDDIAAPGQTYAAHALCSGIPDKLRRHLLLSGSGHFSLFHGNRWRSGVLPPLLHFLEETETRSTLR